MKIFEMDPIDWDLQHLTLWVLQHKSVKTFALKNANQTFTQDVKLDMVSWLSPTFIIL